MLFDPENHPHRRFNPLTGEWILVSPHRRQRPWQGQRETGASSTQPEYDPACYLCPGNERAGGARNPDYSSQFVFSNDYAALLPDTPLAGQIANGLLKSEPVCGECRVICFSPRHDLTLPRMATTEIASVVDVWADQVSELSERYRWVQLFENKGAVMGCSNPHPHGQIWAGSFLPRIPTREDDCQKEYAEKNGSLLLVEYGRQEIAADTRIVVQNDDWLMLVPFWATWPFELLLLPKRSIQRLPDLTSPERVSLADILKRGLTKYDNLFETSFPYSMGWHGAPGQNCDAEHWLLHAHFYPPLLRSATVKKFMVGYEMMAEPQRDLTAEEAARRLRELPETHFLADGGER